ncbi:nucleoside monophosphate kinase [Candidatus Daviesbacteria bacterium]|nr:nucleoside monophosphate kinase [Candidatus Daviesbacteria bacterium]
MKILLIGPQGSGKSTQAEFLAQFLNIPKISTGDIFRQIATEDSENGRKVREIQNSGKLVDDETTARIVEERLKQEDAAGGFIMDGYPRNIRQKDLFDPHFEKVFYLKVPDSEVTKRMLARGRADDTQESIKMRLNLYYQQTKPLLDYYKSQGILTEINGMGSAGKIQDEIRKNISK